VTGGIRDDSGQLVPGAFVEIHRIVDLVRDKFGRTISRGPDFGSSVQAAADGSFAFNSVPEGRYFLCGYTHVSGYLSNCEWNTTAPTTALQASSNIAAASIVLRKGTVIQVIVNDPRGLVKPFTGLSPRATGHYVFPSVRTATGYFGMARFTGGTASQHTYSVTIPTSASVQLFFDTDLSLTDAMGRNIPAKQPSGINVAGVNSTTVSVTVN
jgi:hypothetical protein